MHIITLDFETYYDRNYSLKKITTEEYTRDPRFEIIGVAIQVNDEKAKFFSGTKEELAKVLSGYAWDKSFVLAHNMLFDGAILAWHFGIKPLALLDTLCMARAVDGPNAGNSLAALAVRYNLGVKGDEVLNALGKHLQDFDAEELARYGAYCCNDVDITYRLFNKLVPKVNMIELKLIDLTLRMFTEPILELNLPLLEQHFEEVVERKNALLLKAGTDKDVLMSDSKFAVLLQSVGVDVPTKISPTTGKETWAFAKSDAAFKMLAEYPDEYIQALVAARLGNKSTLEETRTLRMIGIAKRGNMPAPLQYYSAHTGRWGGGDKLNLQNLPARGTNTLKNAITAPDGYVIINADSSQIEARTVAWLAGQNDLVTAFDKGEDVYKIMASAIYHKDPGDVTKEERFVGKTTILGCGYGMGAFKLRAQLAVFNVDLPEEECERIIFVYRETYQRISDLWKQAKAALKAIHTGKTTDIGVYPEVLSVDSEGIRLPSGLHIRYPRLSLDKSGQYTYKAGRKEEKLYGGKVTENFTQAVARCAIGEQMLRIAKRYKVALTVHDSVVCVVRESEVQEATTYITECMKWRPKWAQNLPLTCEVGYGKTYGEA